MNSNIGNNPATSSSYWTTTFSGGGGGSLPTATVSGQAPIATGPGTTYSAQFAGPAGKTYYLANYLANPTVPAQVRWDCSWSISSSPSTITCPSGTFNSSMTGWIAWATQLDPRGDGEQANDFACGSAGTNPVVTYVNSSTITINAACSVASSGGSGVGGWAFAFGPDETSTVDTWILAVANSCGYGVLPAGNVMTKHGGGGWNLTSSQNTNCANALADHGFSPLVQGQGQSQSTLVIEPAFDFTTCTGGPTNNTCFGSAQSSTVLNGGYSFSDFSINGFGITLDSSSQINWVEMLNGNYANNFAITKLGGTGVSHTVGIKFSGSFGQFWNMISDWSGAIPCWVASGGTYSPISLSGASECVGGSGANVTSICSSNCNTYGVLVTSGGGLVSYGSTWAGGNSANVSSDVTIVGGSYTGYGDFVCCNNSGSVMGLFGLFGTGGAITLDGLTGGVNTMGNGSHFMFNNASGSTVSLRNTKIVIGGGSSQQCYVFDAGTLIDGGNNSCTGASLADSFANAVIPLNLLSPLTIAQGGTGSSSGSGLIQSLTNTGSSGAATYSGGVLNIPEYSGGGGGSGAMTLISSQTLISTATSVTFSSIPQTYTTLHLIGTFQEGGGGSNLDIRFNGDTAADYGQSYLYNNGATAAAGNAASQTLSILAIGTVGSVIADIPLYHGSAFSTTYFTAQSSGPGSTVMATEAGSWSNTGVTSITIFDNSGASFSIGTTFSLYGIQ